MKCIAFSPKLGKNKKEALLQATETLKREQEHTRIQRKYFKLDGVFDK